MPLVPFCHIREDLNALRCIICSRDRVILAHVDAAALAQQPVLLVV
eukprot:CAMPEP_0179466880 /NCGR_PEP_ID=MMETSP0799-20121207/48124_1 /TAXON_ID=46947 /ORGANISM="Geminigera cryophila, Strain CCMP2564" /LENGTH=45 /DNA_ID= /DNA_START= /DNA_END= /DNA_ORIENTATION=